MLNFVGKLKAGPACLQFDGGAGDEIRTHDILLGKQTLYP